VTLGTPGTLGKGMTRVRHLRCGASADRRRGDVVCDVSCTRGVAGRQTFEPSHS